MKKTKIIKLTIIPANSCGGGGGCYFKKTLPFGIVKKDTKGIKKAA